MRENRASSQQAQSPTHMRLQDAQEMIFRLLLDGMVLTTHHCSGQQLEDGEIGGVRWEGGGDLRAETMSKATESPLCGGVRSGHGGGAPSNSETDRLLGAVVYSVCIFAFGASAGSLNQCKWTWHDCQTVRDHRLFPIVYFPN